MTKAELEAEVRRLQACVEAQKAASVVKGPFSPKRSVGRHANLLLAENQKLKATLMSVETLADAWEAGAPAPEPGVPIGVTFAKELRARLNRGAK